MTHCFLSIDQEKLSSQTVIFPEIFPFVKIPPRLRQTFSIKGLINGVRLSGRRNNSNGTALKNVRPNNASDAARSDFESKRCAINNSTTAKIVQNAVRDEWAIKRGFVFTL
jgi:hypothetical protein